MGDADALIQVFIEEAIRRKKAEAQVAALLAENQRLASRLTELESASKDKKVGADNG